MARTLIHIGMPRTASTFLQQEFFPKVGGFTFYGVETTQYSLAFQRLLYQDDSLFDDSAFEAIAKKIRSENAILSNELFVGQSLYLNSTNRSRIAHRLKRFFPDAEILIMLRNQVSLLQSLYAIGVYSGHTCSPEEFVRFSDAISDVDNPLYPTFAQAETTEGLQFSPLITLYQNLFSEVHVLLFEDFKSDPTAFAERLTTLLQLENVEFTNSKKRVNQSLSARQLKLIKRLNHYKPVLNRNRFGKWLFGFKLRFIEHRIVGKIRFTFSDKTQRKLRETFYADNRKLQTLLPHLNDSESFRKHYLRDDKK